VAAHRHYNMDCRSDGVNPIGAQEHSLVGARLGCRRFQLVRDISAQLGAAALFAASFRKKME